MFGEPIEQRCRHLGVSEYERPFAEDPVGVDHDGGPPRDHCSPGLVSARYGVSAVHNTLDISVQTYKDTVIHFWSEPSSGWKAMRTYLMDTRMSSRRTEAVEPRLPARDEGRVDRNRHHRIAVIVADGFSLVTLSGLLEPIRIANQFSNGSRIHCKTVGLETRHVISSGGLKIDLDHNLGSYAKEAFLELPDAVILCSGDRVEHQSNWLLRSLLRRLISKNVEITAVGTATWLLADAGLLHGRKCTIHWSKAALFAETYRDVKIQNRILLQEGRLVTSPGEVATFDLCLNLIASLFGDPTAELVSDYLVKGTTRHPETRQYRPPALKYATFDDNLIGIISLMEENIAAPQALRKRLSRGKLSRRQVQRLFRNKLGVSPYQYYRKLRLDRAKDLLGSTDMTVLEIAIACGFSSSSQFSKCFRDEFSCRPSDVRARTPLQHVPSWP